MVNFPRWLLPAAAGFLGSLAFGQNAGQPAFSAAELAQGYCDADVLAKPRGDRLATVDAEETAEGTRLWRKFDRFGGLRVIEVNPGESPAVAIARLSATGRYDFVEPDFIKHAYATPNDPDFGEQWGLNNTGANPTIAGPGIAGADIHAAAAWNTRTDASGVVVAVADSGAWLTHLDLVANFWQNPQENSDGYVNDLYGINATVAASNPDSGNPLDDNGHGTHVSGIIGAVGNNGTDTSGVAWKARLMELKFIGSNGSGSTAAEVTCLDFALSHGAAVVNGSFGSSQASQSEFTALQALQAAGVIAVVAAGNDGEDNDLSPAYPACYLLDNIVTVACSDNRDDAVYFTGYGSGTVDLFAPGTNIVSLYNSSNTATATLSGTSMSTPFVTGSLALLKAQYPSDSYRQLINRLLRSVDLNSNFTGRTQTGGRLDLAQAVTSAPGANTPFNDNFADRPRLVGPTLVARSSNAGATREPGEPTIAGNPGGASLWWEWTAPLTGTLTLTTAGSAYPTLLGAYTGSDLAGLSAVAAAAAAGSGASSLSFAVQAGATYQLTVDGQNGATGLTVLNLNYANDTFDSPVMLSGASLGLTAGNIYATRQAGEPEILGQSGGHSLWYSWTAPSSGQFQISAYSYDFDPLLAVYTGASLTSLSLVAANAGSPIASSATVPASLCTCTFSATAGTTYNITVDGNVDSNGVNEQFNYGTATPIGAGQFTLSIADSAWQASAGDSITCAPAVGTDGTVYVGSTNSIFSAFSPDGSGKWSTAAGGSFDTNSAALSTDGTAVYAGAGDGNLYAFSTANGALLWKYALAVSPVASSPAVGADGTIYVKDSGSTLYALTPAGGLKWSYTIPGVSYASPSIGGDGTIYIGSDNANLYALSPTGTLIWVFTAASAIYNAPAIDSSGNLYFGTLGGTFYAVNRAGVQAWSFQAGNSISSSPALNAGGSTVYFGCYDHNLYALATGTGALQWTFATGGEIRASSPAVDANGVIYLGSYDDNLYAVNPSGSLDRVYAAGDWIRSSPVIFGTTLYFGSNDHKLYAFNLDASLSASPWPMYMCNARRFGRSAGLPPGISAQPQAVAVNAGSTAILSVTATGATGYQWYLNNSALPGATGATLTLANIGTLQAGSYTVVASNPAGSLTSSPALVTVGTDSRLINLSILSLIQGSLSMGFVIGGSGTSGSEPLLIRGLGPAIGPGTTFDTPGVIADPALTVVQQSNQALVASNSGWGSNQGTVTAADSATGAFALTNPSSLDSALVVSLPSVTGGYSATVAGKSGDDGYALTEVYDDTTNTSPADPRLINLSCLTQIAAGGSLDVGFVIGGSTAETLLIRVTGPALASAPFNISGILPDPKLSVQPLSNPNTPVATDSGWGGNSQVTAAESLTGAFSLGNPASLDSAVVVTLAPGIPYVVGVASASGAGGIVLVEIYEVP